MVLDKNCLPFPFSVTHRRVKISYLEWQNIYDEWIDFDTDSHRISHVGTKTHGISRFAVTENQNEEESDNREELLSQRDDRNRDRDRDRNGIESGDILRLFIVASEQS